MQYKYFYTKRTAAKIRSFYRNVGKKYRHTYSYEDMERNVRDAFFAIYAIERTLPRRRPTISAMGARGRKARFCPAEGQGRVFCMCMFSFFYSFIHNNFNP